MYLKIFTFTATTVVKCSIEENKGDMGRFFVYGVPNFLPVSLVFFYNPGVRCKYEYSLKHWPDFSHPWSQW